MQYTYIYRDESFLPPTEQGFRCCSDVSWKLFVARSLKDTHRNRYFVIIPLENRKFIILLSMSVRLVSVDQKHCHIQLSRLSETLKHNSQYNYIRCNLILTISENIVFVKF